LQVRLKFVVFSLEAPGRVSDASNLAGKFEQAMRSTMECTDIKPPTGSLFLICSLGAALRSLLEVALVFGNTLNKVHHHVTRITVRQCPIKLLPSLCAAAVIARCCRDCVLLPSLRAAAVIACHTWPG
jgi:hypothetical protein